MGGCAPAHRRRRRRCRRRFRRCLHVAEPVQHCGASAGSARCRLAGGWRRCRGWLPRGLARRYAAFCARQRRRSCCGGWVRSGRELRGVGDRLLLVPIPRHRRWRRGSGADAWRAGALCGQVCVGGFGVPGAVFFGGEGCEWTDGRKLEHTNSGLVRAGGACRAEPSFSCAWAARAGERCRCRGGSRRRSVPCPAWLLVGPSPGVWCWNCSAPTALWCDSGSGVRLDFPCTLTLAHPRVALC